MHIKRERIIRDVKRRLLNSSLPRLQMSLILLLTGLGGFLASFSLLHLGLAWMWLRYPLAILFAYSLFLLLLRLWLFLQQPRSNSLSSSIDLPNVDLSYSPSANYSKGFSFSGGGGDAGGGGAGVSWGNSAVSTSSSSSSSSGDGSFLGNLDLDLEEGWLLIIAIVAILGGVLATLYVIYIAPALLAEILVDGVLVTGLYRQLNKVEQRHWLRAAVRKTLLPAILATILFTVAGYAMQRAVPEARSIGEVWRHVKRS